jgi:tetratricopeptide (TPR) repeat protein
MHPEVEEILSRRYANYREPLQQVWAWNREARPDSLAKAEELARGLKERFKHALQVRYELALALVKQKRRPEALKELADAGRDFPVLDEDTLCLWGRCHKDEADNLLANGLLAEAEVHYRLAEEYYEKAYQLRHDRFPGINVAALRLIRASLLLAIARQEPGRAELLTKQAEALRQGSRDMAWELLAARDRWEMRLPDDNIWVKATAAEAELLRGRWQEAARLYQFALAEPNLQQHHRDSMRAQVMRLTEAYARQGEKPEDPLADPELFFAAAPPA